MHEVEQAIANWRAQMERMPFLAASTIDELQDHLQQSIDSGVDGGMNTATAIDAALQSLGNPQSLNAEYRKVDLPWIIAKRILFGIGILYASLLAISYMLAGTVSLSYPNQAYGVSVELAAFMLVPPSLKFLALMLIVILNRQFPKTRIGVLNSSRVLPTRLAMIYGLASLLTALLIMQNAFAESLVYLACHSIDALILWRILVFVQLRTQLVPDKCPGR